MAPKRKERSLKGEEDQIGEIPIGWNVKYEIQKDGSKKTTYYCPDSGQHFYTYAGLIRYVEYAKEYKAGIYGRSEFKDVDYNIKIHIKEKIQHKKGQVSQSKSKCSSSTNVCASNRSHNHRPVQFNISQKDNIMPFMHQFIEKVLDVEGDGHCGFRVVAGLLGMSIDDHHIIRLDLLQELTSDCDRYLRLIGKETRFNEVKHALTFDGIGPALEDKWMIMPDMGFLIAQKYKCVVVLLSNINGQAETFFPLHGAPSRRNRIICLAYVNDNHFRMVYLKDGCPIPPTSVQWAQHRRDDAEPWEPKYIHRMARYNELSRAAGNEIIGDDDVEIIKNLEMEEKVDDDKKVEDGVKVAGDSLGIDDCSIDLAVD